MNRRDLLRRGIGALGAAASTGIPVQAREFPENYDASKDLARPDWKPQFLDAHQNETLAVLSDIIIPATDTPGAKEALANRFIDAILAVERPEVQREFLNALAMLDGESLERYGAAFIHAKPAEQVELVAYLAYPQSMRTWGESVEGKSGPHRQFRALKDWISRAYYSSEIGQRELGYTGEAPHGELAGCTDAAEKR
jgi:gluconate 2-dehydrogenase gamma chain